MGVMNQRFATHATQGRSFSVASLGRRASVLAERVTRASFSSAVLQKRGMSIQSSVSFAPLVSMLSQQKAFQSAESTLSNVSDLDEQDQKVYQQAMKAGMFRVKLEARQEGLASRTMTVVMTITPYVCCCGWVLCNYF